MAKLKRLSRKQYLRLQQYRPTSPPSRWKGKTKADRAVTEAKWYEEEAEYKASVDRNTAAIIEQMDHPGTEGHVGFENMDMCSSSLGQRAFLPAGPQWTTFKTLAAVRDAETSPFIGDLPSQRKYARYFWSKPRSDEDVEWERLEDLWDETHPHAIEEVVGVRKIVYERDAEEWTGKKLQEWTLSHPGATA